MALLYCPRFVAVDENGDPISGAEFWTYDSVSTSTPKATYSDAARTVEHTNPIVADANGIFPQIFGNEGEAYYCVLLDADGNQIDEFQAVQMIGQDGTSVFSRDFGLNGRLQGYGAAGVVNLEFMPPQGDDTGGAGRIGGAQGTQAETLEIDAAATTFTGTIEAAGLEVSDPSAIQFPYLLASGSPAAQSELIIELSPVFNEYEIRIRDLRGSVSGSPRATLSFDDGDTYKTASDDYLSQSFLQQNSSTMSASGASQGAAMSLGDSVVSSGSGGMDMTIKLVSIAGRESRVISDWGQVAPGSAADGKSGRNTGGTNGKGYGKATHARITLSSGNLTCSYAAYGIR